MGDIAAHVYLYATFSYALDQPIYLKSFQLNYGLKHRRTFHQKLQICEIKLRTINMNGITMRRKKELIDRWRM